MKKTWVNIKSILQKCFKITASKVRKKVSKDHSILFADKVVVALC